MCVCKLHDNGLTYKSCALEFAFENWFKHAIASGIQWMLMFSLITTTIKFDTYGSIIEENSILQMFFI
jgi:hypothetical protein